MGDTKIEWAKKSWNPVTGCTKISAGCVHCYAERMANRLVANPGVKHRERYQGFRPAFWPERLEQPLRWKKPRRIFVCSMADLFHEDVKEEWIDKVFAVMALCPQHTSMVLTKRPERMEHYLNVICPQEFGPVSQAYVICKGREDYWAGKWPLPNVQLGVTCENQAAYDDRAKWLRKCPAAVRFISAEPLLSDIQFGDLKGIHGVIVGGETGPGARPMHPDWVRSVRDQCAVAGVKFFLKSFGDWLPDPLTDWGKNQVFTFPDGVRMFRHGYLARKYEPKRLRELDGQLHNALPEAKQ